MQPRKLKEIHRFANNTEQVKPRRRGLESLNLMTKQSSGSSNSDRTLETSVMTQASSSDTIGSSPLKKKSDWKGPQSVNDFLRATGRERENGLPEDAGHASVEHTDIRPSSTKQVQAHQTSWQGSPTHAREGTSSVDLNPMGSPAANRTNTNPSSACSTPRLPVPLRNQNGGAVASVFSTLSNLTPEKKAKLKELQRLTGLQAGPGESTTTLTPLTRNRHQHILPTMDSSTCGFPSQASMGHASKTRLVEQLLSPSGALFKDTHDKELTVRDVRAAKKRLEEKIRVAPSNMMGQSRTSADLVSPTGLRRTRPSMTSLHDDADHKPIAPPRRLSVEMQGSEEDIRKKEEEGMGPLNGGDYDVLIPLGGGGGDDAACDEIPLDKSVRRIRSAEFMPFGYKTKKLAIPLPSSHCRNNRPQRSTHSSGSDLRWQADSSQCSLSSRRRGGNVSQSHGNLRWDASGSFADMEVMNPSLSPRGGWGKNAGWDTFGTCHGASTMVEKPFVGKPPIDDEQLTKMKQLLLGNSRGGEQAAIPTKSFAKPKRQRHQSVPVLEIPKKSNRRKTVRSPPPPRSKEIPLCTVRPQQGRATSSAGGDRWMASPEKTVKSMAKSVSTSRVSSSPETAMDILIQGQDGKLTSVRLHGSGDSNVSLREALGTLRRSCLSLSSMKQANHESGAAGASNFVWEALPLDVRIHASEPDGATSTLKSRHSLSDNNIFDSIVNRNRRQ